MIGDEFTLDELYDKPINHETLAQATAIIKSKVDELRIRLNAYLAGKGIKRRKLTKKEMRKLEEYNKKQRTFVKQVAERHGATADQAEDGDGDK